MEIFDMSFGSWMLWGCFVATVVIISEVIAEWLAPKILRWYRLKKAGDVDG